MNSKKAFMDSCFVSGICFMSWDNGRKGVSLDATLLEAKTKTEEYFKCVLSESELQRMTADVTHSWNGGAQSFNLFRSQKLAEPYKE